MESTTPNVAPAVPAAPAPAAEEPKIVEGQQPVEPQIPDVVPGSEPVDEPSKAVKELIRVRKRAQEAELELARYKGIVEGAKLPGSPATPAPVAAPVAEKEPVPPKAEDFEKYEEFDQAEKDYLVSKAVWQVEQKYVAEKKREQQAAVAQTWQGKVQKAVEKYEDYFETVANPMFGQSDTVVALIQDSEIGTDMAYFLGKNLAEANRLNSLPPHIAAKEFGKLEMRLMNPAPAEPRKIISQAPEPPAAIPAKGSSAIVDEQDLPMDDFIARRNAAEMERRRGRA